MEKKCEICDSNKGVIFYKKEIYLCTRHRSQMYYYGRILDKTRSDKNRIEIHNDFAKIFYRNREKEKVGYFVVDLDDIDKIKNKIWTINNRGYIVSNTGNEYILLHRFIMNCSPNDNIIVDHISHDLKDNRKINLRKTTNQKNQFNRDVRKDSGTQIKGVYWREDKNKYCAEIRIDNKKIFLGYYDTIADALDIRSQANEEYQQEFSYENSIKFMEDKKYVY